MRRSALLMGEFHLTKGKTPILELPPPLRRAGTWSAAQCWRVDGEECVFAIAPASAKEPTVTERREPLTLQSSDGRIHLTEEIWTLLDDTDIVLIGMGDHVELWPENLWEARVQDAVEAALDAISE